MKKSLSVALILALMGSAALSFAQDANGDNPGMSPGARLERQHDRIEQGVDSGKINKKEHAKLAREGRRINRQRKRDIQKDGGKLDKRDRRKLEKEEIHRSKQIYEDKH